VFKEVFFQKFGTCTRNGSFGAVLVKQSLKPLGVNVMGANLKIRQDFGNYLPTKNSLLTIIGEKI